MIRKITQSGYIVAIVGRPNVGKSTLFNKIIGQNRAILSEIPGTTRDVLYEDTTWNGVTFTLADTAGVESDPKSELEKDILLQTKVALEAADLIIFMVDAHTGQQTEDKKAAEMIRKLNKPVVLTINKAEGKKYDNTIHEFYSLGLGEPVLISAISGRGVGDILDSIVEKLTKISLLRHPGIVQDRMNQYDSGVASGAPQNDDQGVRNDEELIKVAIVGRPNTGKSTLFNQLAKRKLSVVSELPGTTRDIIRTILPVLSLSNGPAKDFQIELTDTAGLRRRGKIDRGIEKFSSLLVIRSVKDADIVLLVIDAFEGVLAQDLHIAQIIEEEKKGAILIVNKWDAIEKNPSITDEFAKYLEYKFIFLSWLPYVYVSALTGQRTDKIIEEILKVWGSLNTKIPSKTLNNLIGTAYASHPPKGRRKPPKIYFASQVAVNPPTIKLKVNYPEELHFSYLRYLEKQLRAKYPLIGAPVRWEIIKSSSADST